MEDEKIVELFFARSEFAIRELDGKYGPQCRALSYNILKNRLDAEECVSDAYLGTWNAIPPRRPNSLQAFVCALVRNCSLTRYRANTARKRNTAYDLAMEEIQLTLADPVGVEDMLEAKLLAKLIEGFLDTLSMENRVIFLRRYWFSDDYARIAKQVGITPKNVSVRLSRIRKDLRTFLSKEGVAV